jgi:hypothetical protein
MMLFHLNITYTVIISWALYYTFMPLTTIPKVPWDTCKGWWNTERCYDAADWASEQDFVQATNVSLNMTKSPVEEYWE